MSNTEQGKQISRMNALKHGLRATDEIFLSHLNPDEQAIFNKIRDSLHNHYGPQTDPEKEIVDRITIQHFRLYRLYNLENQTFANDSKHVASNLDRFARYDWRIERQLRILHNRLRSLFISRGDFSINLMNHNE